MLSTNNILSPAHGRPIASPTQDMVLGLYYLTYGVNEDRKDEDDPDVRVRGRGAAGARRRVPVHDPIRIRLVGKVMPESLLPKGFDASSGATPVIRTTIGRVIFNDAFPDDFVYRNQQMLKADIGRLVDEVVHTYDRATVEQVLDNLKNLGFH